MSKNNGNGFKRRVNQEQFHPDGRLKNDGTFRRSFLLRKQASDLNQQKLGHRPPLYKGSHTDELAYKLALLGATDRQIADALEVTEEALNLWRTKFPSFLQSIIDGRNLADANVANSLYQRACGYSHPDIHVSVYRDKKTGEVEKVITPITKYYPPDTTACIFWLKNRQRDHWRDVLKRDNDGNLIPGDTTNISFTNNTLNALNFANLDLTKLSDDELRMVESIQQAMVVKRLPSHGSEDDENQ